MNYGYEEGFRAGKADRDDRWGSNYKDSYAYQGRELRLWRLLRRPDRIQYYFREGFRRGYEDGYNSRYQYGDFTSGNYSILDDHFVTNPQFPGSALKTQRMER